MDLFLIDRPLIINVLYKKQNAKDHAILSLDAKKKHLTELSGITCLKRLDALD